MTGFFWVGAMAWLPVLGFGWYRRDRVSLIWGAIGGVFVVGGVFVFVFGGGVFQLLTGDLMGEELSGSFYLLWRRLVGLVPILLLLPLLRWGGTRHTSLVRLVGTEVPGQMSEEALWAELCALTGPGPVGDRVRLLALEINRGGGDARVATEVPTIRTDFLPSSPATEPQNPVPGQDFFAAGPGLHGRR